MDKPLPNSHLVQDMSCQVCGASRFKIFLPATHTNLSSISPDYFSPYNSSRGHFQIVECSDCKHLYCTPIVDFTNLNYRNAPMDFLIDAIPWKEISASRNLKFIERYTSRGKLLEIGSGLGAFLSAAAKRGWQATGIEPNAEAVKYLKEIGLDVTEGMFNSDNYPDRSFDCVVLDGVLDHLVDPRTVIEQCHRILKPNGTVFATVCHGRGLLPKIMGRRTLFFQYQHLNYFSRKTLITFFRSLNYTVLKISPNLVTYPVNYYFKWIENSIPLAKVLAKQRMLNRVTWTLPVGNLEIVVRKC